MLRLPLITPRPLLCLGLLVSVAVLAGPATRADAASIRSLAGLESVVVFERTGGSAPTPFGFAPDSDAVLERIDVLSDADRDFFGFTTENYDLYYSDADGTPNVDGAFLTVDGLFALTSDAGYNVAEVALVINGVNEFASGFTRVRSRGAFASPNTADLAVDGDLDTHTFLGDSMDQNDRLSMTFAFTSTAPEASTALLLGASLVVLGLRRRR